MSLFVCMCVCVCVRGLGHACVSVRERECVCVCAGARTRAITCEHTCVYASACVFIVRLCVRARVYVSVCIY